MSLWPNNFTNVWNFFRIYNYKTTFFYDYQNEKKFRLMWWILLILYNLLSVDYWVLFSISVMHAGFFGWGGARQMFGESDFSRVERNFTIGQSPKIWGNYSKIRIKINKYLQNCWENSRKMQIFRKFFNFLAGYNFLIMGKIRNIIWTGYNGGFGGRSPRK